MKKTKDKPEDAATFEAQLARLEELVAGLESGEKGLEESLSLFEEGVGLSKRLAARLDEVKTRVEVLTKDAKGKLTARDAGAEELGG